MYSREGMVPASLRHPAIVCHEHVLIPLLSCPPRFPFVSARALRFACSSCAQLAWIARQPSGSGGILSAGEESTLLGHLVAVFEVCADHPGHSDDAAEDEAHDGRVAFPVSGLGVPTSGRRPDVLWVSSGVSYAPGEALRKSAYGTLLPPPPMIARYRVVSWWCCPASFTEVAMRCGARRLGHKCLAEKFGQSRLDAGSPHDTVQVLLLSVVPAPIPSRPSYIHLFNEANTLLTMRLAIAGNPRRSPPAVSLQCGEHHTAERHII